MTVVLITTSKCYDKGPRALNFTSAVLIQNLLATLRIIRSYCSSEENVIRTMPS